MYAETRQVLLCYKQYIDTMQCKIGSTSIYVFQLLL